VYADESGPHVLVLSFTEVGRDPRVLRHIRALQKDYRLTVAGHGPDPRLGCTFVALPHAASSVTARLERAAMFLARRDERWYWSRPEVEGAVAALGAGRFDLVLANDIETLPLALRIADGAPVHFDAHEYHPREFEEQAGWRLVIQPHVRRMCERYIPRAATMSTVSPGIAAEYERVFGIRPAVVINAPAGEALAPSATDPGAVRLVYHGGAIRSKRIEVLIDAASRLPTGFGLDLLLVPTDARYVRKLAGLVARTGRVRLLPPVAAAEVLQTLNRYDLGLCILEDVSFNNANALPNKFFECLHAGIGVVVGPSGDMARLVRSHGCGLVTPSFAPADIARALASLDSAGIASIKSATRPAAASLGAASAAEVLRGCLCSALSPGAEAVRRALR
jgi:glycosyltransferase involved in cell wall biosynthesis